MNLIFRILAGLVGLAMGLSGVRWIIDPAGSAAGLGMPLLEDMGASTQIGDFAAFFLAIGVFVAVAQRRGASRWLLAAALLLGLAATMRTLAFAFGHAPFGAIPIAAEVVMATILVTSARLRAGSEDAPATDG